MVADEYAQLRQYILNVINDENVHNEKGEPYIIDRKEYTGFFDGTINLHNNLKSSISFYSVRENIENNLSDLFDDLIKEDEHDKVASELLEALDYDETIDKDLKTEIQSLDISDPYSIVAKIFIYALGNNNKTGTVIKKIPLVNDFNPEKTVDEIIKLLSQLPKPVVIDIPTEISATEMIYVSAILEAFAEDSGVSLISQDELISKDEYAKYKRQFDRYRRE